MPIEMSETKMRYYTIVELVLIAFKTVPFDWYYYQFSRCLFQTWRIHLKSVMIPLTTQQSHRAKRTWAVEQLIWVFIVSLYHVCIAYVPYDHHTYMNEQLNRSNELARWIWAEPSGNDCLKYSQNEECMHLIIQYYY